MRRFGLLVVCLLSMSSFVSAQEDTDTEMPTYAVEDIELEGTYESPDGSLRFDYSESWALDETNMTDDGESSLYSVPFEVDEVSISIILIDVPATLAEASAIELSAPESVDGIADNDANILYQLGDYTAVTVLEELDGSSFLEISIALNHRWMARAIIRGEDEETIRAQEIPAAATLATIELDRSITSIVSSVLVVDPLPEGWEVVNTVDIPFAPVGVGLSQSDEGSIDTVEIGITVINLDDIGDEMSSDASIGLFLALQLIPQEAVIEIGDYEVAQYVLPPSEDSEEYLGAYTISLTDDWYFIA
ncbi:MAG: hypothetical protein AAF126_19915, partial [Chloroflexota bacterium]